MTKDANRYLFTRGGVEEPEVRYRLSGVKRELHRIPAGQHAHRVRRTRAPLPAPTSIPWTSTRHAPAHPTLRLFRPSASMLLMSSVTSWRMLDMLEAERDARLSSAEPGPHVITDEERQAGLEFLSSPDLISHIEADLGPWATSART